MLILGLFHQKFQFNGRLVKTSYLVKVCPVYIKSHRNALYELEIFYVLFFKLQCCCINKRFRTFQGLKKHYHEDKAPAGFDFKRFTDFLDSYINFRNRYPDNDTRLADVAKHDWRVVIMAAMHFQDVYNYETPRVQRCVIHYATPNGRMYPFCSYNCGPCYRLQVEEEFSRKTSGALEPAK